MHCGLARFIAKKSVDFVVVGEGEQPFVEYCRRWIRGREQIDIANGCLT